MKMYELEYIPKLFEEYKDTKPESDIYDFYFVGLAIEIEKKLFVFVSTVACDWFYTDPYKGNDFSKVVSCTSILSESIVTINKLDIEETIEGKESIEVNTVGYEDQLNGSAPHWNNVNIKKIENPKMIGGFEKYYVEHVKKKVDNFIDEYKENIDEVVDKEKFFVIVGEELSNLLEDYLPDLNTYITKNNLELKLNEEDIKFKDRKRKI